MGVVVKSVDENVRFKDGIKNYSSVSRVRLLFWFRSLICRSTFHISKKEHKIKLKCQYLVYFGDPPQGVFHMGMLD